MLRTFVESPLFNLDQWLWGSPKKRQGYLVIAMVFLPIRSVDPHPCVCVNPTLSNIRLENENFLFFRTLTSFSNGTDG